MDKQKYFEMRKRKYEEGIQTYVRQSSLMEGVRKGDLDSMYALVDDLIAGRSAYASPATDVVLSVQRAVSNDESNRERGAALLERIVTESKKDEVRGFEIWGGSERCRAASFALRTLVEDFNYSPNKAAELAESFNVNVATPGEHLNILHVHNGAYTINLKSGVMKKAA